MILIRQLLESMPRKIELSLLQDFDADLLEAMLDDSYVELCLHNYEIGGLLEDALEELKTAHEKRAREEDITDFKLKNGVITKVGYIAAEELLICDYFIQGVRVDHWVEDTVKIETIDKYHYKLHELGGYPSNWSKAIELTKLCQANYSAMG